MKEWRREVRNGKAGIDGIVRDKGIVKRKTNNRKDKGMIKSKMIE